MRDSAINTILLSLEAEHVSILNCVAKIRKLLNTSSDGTRAEIHRLNRLLKGHFFREDMELYPLVIRIFHLKNKTSSKPVILFESSDEKQARERYGIGGASDSFWESAYDDRDMKSELVSFAKITLQVFEILSEYMNCHDRRGKCADLNARIAGVLHILEARIEYEEEELFPKIRELA